MKDYKSTKQCCVRRQVLRASLEYVRTALAGMAERSPLDYEKRDLKRCQNPACWCRPGAPSDSMVS
ncbi:hypothetical protein SAMN05414139_06945 [Burkholderia sp. D7]|nr:hypothetical protein SAMN05414139_06945 [Burkholderia sp. D7]